MPDVSYKGYTIKVQSQLLPTGNWKPMAMVWWNEETKSIGQTISGESQDTQARANAVALARAKAWVDARVSRNPPHSTL
jgi:hypothetical protein